RTALAAEMRTRVNRESDPRKRLQAVGAAYIDFALAQPGLFRTAFTSHPATSDDDDHDRPAGPEAGSQEPAEPYEVLRQALDEAQAAGLLDARRRAGAQIAIWSAVHCLACFWLDGPPPTPERGIQCATRSRSDLT